MIKSSYKIETYIIGQGFYLDLVIKRNDYEAWIYHKNYGIKTMIYGMSQDDIEKEEFLEILEDTLEEDKNFYKSEYMEV